MLAVYGAMSLAPTLLIFSAYRHADYDGWIARLSIHIPQEARVMGNMACWIGLRERQYISNVPPYFNFSDWRSEVDAAAFILEQRPEFLIQTSDTLQAVGGLAPRPSDLSGTLFGRACEQVAAQVPSQVLTEFYDRDFGAVRVWRLDWPTSRRSTAPASSGSP